jgi:hypothetical protein
MFKQFLVFSLLLSLLGSVSAQREVLPFYPNLVTCAGATLNLRFSLNTGEVARWEFSGATPSGITFPAPNTAAEGVLSGTVDPLASPGDFPFAVRAIIGGITYTRNYILKVKSTCSETCPGQRDYVLLIDQSGSMAGPAPGGGTKWDVMKDAVKIFLPALKSGASLGADDRLWIAFFGRNDPDQLEVLTGSPFTFAQTWIERPNEIQDLVFEVGGVDRTPDWATPLGGGMQKAFVDFFGMPPFAAGSTVMRSMIIFTDGMQNQNPMTGDPNDLAATHNNITNLPTYSPTNGVLNTPGVNIPLNTSGGNKFKIFTIGVGASPGFRDQLRKIAEPADLYAQADVATNTELNRFFTTTIPNSLKECSPRILDYRVRDIASPAVQSERFRVNRFVNNLTITLYSNRRIYDDPPGFALFKDGIEMDVPYVLDDNKLIYSINFPVRQGNNFIDETGVWELRYPAQKGEKYDVCAIVEDKSISAQLNVGNGAVFYPGETIPVTLNLRYEGQAMQGVNVSGILLRPGEDLGDLAARTEKALTGTPKEAGTDPGQHKIDLLMSDPAFYEKLVKTGQIVPFSDKGDGNYAFDFKAGEVTGTYQAIVFFKGSAAGSGDYEGWESKCVLVDFGTASSIELNPVLQCQTTTGSVTKKSQTCTLTLRPTNRYGKLLGPGQSNRISLQSSNGSFSKLKDNLDGTYQTQVTYAGSSPDLSVFVVDGKTPIYQGGLRGILSDKPWGISGHAGITVPLDGLDSLHTNGYYLGFDLTYRLSSTKALELMAGYYTFGSDLDLLGGTLSYKLMTQTQSPWFLHGSVGAGAYTPDNSTVWAAASGRAGVSYKASQNLHIGLDASLQYLPKPDAYFATFGVAAHYFF